MKKIYSIMLLALFGCVTAWAAQTAVNLSVGSGQTYETVSAALASVSSDGKITANQNITITLTSNVTEASTVAVNMTNGNSSSKKITVNLSLGGYTLNADLSLIGGGQNYSILDISGGNFNGSVTAPSDQKAKLTLNYNLGGSIALDGFTTAGRVDFSGTATTMTANISLNNTSFSIKAGKTFTGAFTVAGNKILTIVGTYTGAITFADGNEAKLYMNNADAEFKPSSVTGAPYQYDLRAGKTNFDPSAYLTDAYEAVANGTNPETWTVQEATNAVRIGETEYKTFALAYEAAAENATLVLLKDCKITSDATLTKAFTTSGDFDLIVEQNATVQFNSASTIAHLVAYGNVVVGGATINLASLAIANGKSFTLNSGTVTVANTINLQGALAITGGTLNANVNLSASSASFAMSNGTLNGNVATPGATGTYNTINISGGTINGAINITHYGTNLAIGGVTVVSENGPALRSMATNNLTISSGSYTNNGEGEVVEGGNGSYKLTLQGGTYNKQPNAAYIPEGYEVVGSGPYTVQAAAAEFVSVSKNGGAAQSFSNMSEFIAYLPLANDGSTYTITLLRDYSMDFGDGLEIYSNNTCTLDLNGHQLTASGNNNKSKLLVGGTLILNANGGSIVIPNDNGISVLNGGKATINGGTYTTDEYNSTAFYADAEGKLIINGATIDATVGCAIRSKGNAIVKNTTITSACNAMYAVINAGNMSLISTNVTGNHGAVACIEEAGTLDIDGGVFRAVNQELSDAYAALYVATSSMVSAKNAKFYSDRENYAVLTGDNDSGKTFGIVNLYDGCYLSHKMFVSAKKVQDSEITFPVQLAESSAWYASFNNYGPLPAGYEYADSDIEGYAWKVVSLATETKEAADDPSATIPWQQSSTWDATKQSTSTEEVPAATTVVTIPADKEVVISGDPTKNNGVTEAAAEQIFIGTGASLTVETGTTLTVGDGGVNIANGGSLTVQPGAIVTVGAAGLITTEEDALVIEGTEEDQGVFLIAPEVTENTQPKATVKLVTKAKQVAANEFIWERFAIPTLDGNATVYSNEGLDTVHYYGGGSSLQEGLYEWSGSNWAPVSSWKNLQPFKGYQLTNNSMYGNVVYTFEGNLVGNADQDYAFAQSGFGFFGNSYSGDIDIKKFMESFGENMQKTIWIYDYYTDGFKAITESSYGSVYYGKRNARHGLITDIRSMQAFLMNTFAEGESATSVDYSAAIWGNPKYGLVSNTPAPAPKRVAANEDKLTIYVAGAKQEDEVSFIRSNAYSSAFDNGADASKWMNNGLNLYVVTEDGEMAAVAADEIADMTIAFQSGNETEYTLGFDNISGEEFALRDVLTGAVITIAEGTTYTFTQAANTTVPARFQIIGTHKMPTGIENAIEGANVQQKVMLNGNLYILRDNKWYSAQGQLVK